MPCSIKLVSALNRSTRLREANHLIPERECGRRVVAAKVHGVAPGPADPMPANLTAKFHRLFSDIDGDGDSDNADLFQFRSTYNKFSPDPAYNANCDYDADGDVDNADIFQIRSRRGITLMGY